MAKVDLSFNFGFNRKPKKRRGGGKKGGKKSDAWRSYVGTGRRRR